MSRKAGKKNGAAAAAPVAAPAVAAAAPYAILRTNDGTAYPNSMNTRLHYLSNAYELKPTWYASSNNKTC